MKHRPMCSKMQCRRISDAVLCLPMFGPVYFCADHALSNLRGSHEILLADIRHRSDIELLRSV
jgi:hypothetical protein